MGKRNQYQSSNFSLFVENLEKQTLIEMQLFIDSVNTRDFPKTLEFIKENFPAVLKTECFNEKNLKFSEEVKATEIGHLFEHILLEQLCIIKMSTGKNSAVFNGRTDWNWERDPRGMFHIFLDVGKKDFSIFVKALENTIGLVENFINISKTPTDNLKVLAVEVATG